METLPNLTNQFTLIDTNIFDVESREDMSNLEDFIKDCINGSCCAIVCGNEILYNNYVENTSQRELIIQELSRTLIANNPFFIIRALPELSIKIYMYYTNSWYLHITYTNGFYKILFFN